MTISPRDALTNDPQARFFLAPETPQQRQYEALRAYFVEKLPSHVVAHRFGYTPGAFRVLCHQFRHDPAKRAVFFPPSTPGPHSAPKRDRVRNLVVAMRKRNLSVYDIRRELADAGHTISINALSVLLREEGFARLPRRLDEERPQALRPEAAAMADVRALSLLPRSFRTRLGGLWLFVPLMRQIRLPEVLRPAGLPGSASIPAEQAVRTLLALKLSGKERKSHVMDLVCDEGIALFAGLNVVPKRSYLAAYSSRVDRRANLRLLEAWSDEAHRVGLPRGGSFDLDFHTVPANSQEEPPGEALCLQPESSPEGRPGLLRPRRDRAGALLCQRRYPQGAAARRDPEIRGVLGEADRGRPCRVGVRLAVDDACQSQPVESARGPLHDPAASHARHAEGDLEPSRLGVAADHPEQPDAHLPHSPGPG